MHTLSKLQLPKMQFYIFPIKTYNMKKVKIELKGWDYECGDGCCYMFGTNITVNGVKSNNPYDGDSVKQALEFTLKQLGFEVDIESKYQENYNIEELKKFLERHG